ncbi:MAG: hypothetical protein IT479_03755 [Xanthomonadales bacterium]|nr:Adaptive-response sensory-kinase SasA [Xanthomonadales bacterium]MCC6592367.1 hypothetical protein [Xanthomonadales bacterium]
MKGSLHARLLWTALAPLVLLLAAGAGWLHATFAAAVQGAWDERLTAALDALVAGTEVRVDGSVAQRRPLAESGYAQVRSGWYWQIDDAGSVLRRSRSLWDAELALPAAPADGSVAHQDAIGPDGRALRLAHRQVRRAARAQPLRFVVSAPRSGIDAELATFARLLVAGTLGGLLLAALALALQVRLGLRPLRDLRQQLAEIESGARARLDRPTATELAELVEKFNTVLDHDQRMATRGRKLAGDLAHALKTPLALLRSDPALAGSTAARDALQRLDGIVQRHLAQASAQARRERARTALAPALEALATMFRKLHAARSLDIEVECAPTLVATVEADDVSELLGNLIDNACRVARRRVRITAQRATAELRIEIDDDGPGLPAEALAGLGQRGQRLDEQSGAGLGVSISRDIVESYAGTLVYARSALGGLRASVHLPDSHITAMESGHFPASS